MRFGTVSVSDDVRFSICDTVRSLFVTNEVDLWMVLHVVTRQSVNLFPAIHHLRCLIFIFQWYQAFRPPASVPDYTTAVKCARWSRKTWRYICNHNAGNTSIDFYNLCTVTSCTDHLWNSYMWRVDAVVSGVGQINEVTLRRARLVLGWGTISGFNSWCRKFISV